MANSGVVGLLRAILSADTAAFDSAMTRSGDGAQQWSRSLKDAGKQAESVGQQISDGLTASLTKLAAAFSISHLIDSAVEGLLEFGKSAFTSSAQIVDLSEKLGVSTDAIQRYQYVAEQSGTSVDAFGTAAFRLGVNVSKGTDAVQAALTALGLSYTQLKGMKPEEQFDLVAQALAGVADVQERNQIGVALMGKGYGDIAAAISTYTEKAKEANIATADSVHAMAEAKKALDGLLADLEAGTINQVGNAILGIKGLTSSWGTFATTMEQLAQGHYAAAAAVALAKGVTDQQAKSAAEAAKSTTAFTAAVEESTPAVKDQTAKLTDAEKAALAYAKQVQALADTFSGKKLAEQIQLTADAVHAVGGESGLTAYQLQQLDKELITFVQQGGQLPGILNDIYIDQELWLRGITGTTAGLQKLIATLPSVTLANPFPELEVSTDSSWKAIKDFAGPNETKAVFAEWKKDAEDALITPFTELVDVLGVVEGGFRSLAHSGSSAMQEISQDTSQAISLLKEYQQIQQMSGTQKNVAIAGAAAGGIGNVVSGIQSGSKAKGAIAGAEEGLTIGMYGGPIGMAVGAGVGAIAGAVAASKHNTTKDAREQLAEQLGFTDLGALYDDLQKQGQGALATTGSQVIGRHDETANTAWMKQVEDFYDTLHQQQQTIVDDLSTLDQSFADLGVTAPAALDDTINQLIKIGDTKDAQTGMDDLTGALKKYQDQIANANAFKSIEQEMQDVGLEAGDMNSKFKQAADEDSARTIAQEWNDLAPYVGNVGVLADKFQTQMQEMVDNSQQFGTAIPESMKPIIQSLIDQGKLVDQNNDKLTDMSGLNIEEDPLAKGLDDLNDTLQDLVKVLQHDLPQAAADSAQGMQDAYNEHPLVIPIHYAADDAPPAPGGGTPPPQIGLQGGTHGQFLDWGSGTAVTLHGKEAVVPEGEAVAGGSGQPIQITVISQLDGRQVARNQVRYIPRELGLSGI